MTKGRKTTFEERVEIVQYCIKHSHNYSETAKKFHISYQQARSYTIRYEENGVDGLQDKRGKRKSPEEMTEVEKLRAEVSAANTGLNFTIALNYGSRDEMVRAMRHMAQDCKDGAFDPEEITEEKFASYLDTKDLPDPDLMIRTSGEQRLSNWMLWQLAYAEFYFTDVLWPDFDKEELIRAVEYYNTRDRRFGGV